MLKLLTFMALFICFVHCNDEYNVDTLSSNEPQIPTEHDDKIKNTFQFIKRHYLEEKKSSKPCKENKTHRFDSKNIKLFDSSPLTATPEQTNTASVRNKFISSSVHGANYNYKNKNTDTVNNDFHSKNWDCDNCVVEANKKVLQLESLELGGNNNPLSKATIDFMDESKLTDNNSTHIHKGVMDGLMTDNINNISRSNVPFNINAGERKRPYNKELNINTRRSKCGRINVSENLPITPITRRILPGIIENPTNQDLEDNKLYQDGSVFNHNNEMDTEQKWHDKLALLEIIENPTNQEVEDYKLYQDDPQVSRNDELEMEPRQNYFTNVQKVSNSYDIDFMHNMKVNEVPQKSSPERDSVENQLIEPTRGKGIYDMKEVGVMLLEHSRVCYACSTMSDPTCWTPDKRTTVKYCRKGHQSCLTKSFKHNGKSVIIRDCGSYCVNLPNGEENYSSCSICHSDLCNGAVPINIYNTGIAIIVSFGILFNT